MVKQGHYAKASRKKMIRQFKQHHAPHEDQAIDPLKVKDFLLVRYHLTQAKQQRVVVQKAMQQFFGNWLTLAQQAGDATWNVTTLTKQTLELSNTQLPWQYYAVLDQQFAQWQDFLMKEAPAVPLVKRIQLTATLSPATWQSLLSQQLAINGLLGTLGRDQQQLAQVTTAQVEQLQASLLSADRLVWSTVATLCAPIKIDVSQFDSGMQGLIRRLERLTVNDFD